MLAMMTMMMTIFYKYISGEKQRSYRRSEVLSWCMSFSAMCNTLMVSFHTDHNNEHFNKKLQLTFAMTFSMGTCAGTDTVLEIYSWNSLNVGT